MTRCCLAGVLLAAAASAAEPIKGTVLPVGVPGPSPMPPPPMEPTMR